MAIEKTVAIVLAAGQGRRMNSTIKKQYLCLEERPVLYYSLQAFEQSPVDEIILVTSADEINYCQEKIVARFGFQKVSMVIAGGDERYHSVYQALKEIKDCKYVLIHDGARPLIDNDIIEAVLKNVRKTQACVVGMPVKDTIRIVDQRGYSLETPVRESLWAIQTPQAFFYPLIKSAYDQLMQKNPQHYYITDDAMVLEAMTGEKVKLIQGSYKNIKITTAEDLFIAQILMKNRGFEK